MRGEAHRRYGVIVAQVLETLNLDGAGDMADRVIAVRVVPYLEYHQVFVLDVVGEPVGIDQEVGLGIGNRTEAQKQHGK